MNRVTIFGGCCSRDTFNYTKDIKVHSYFSRTSMVSMYSPLPKEDINLDSVGSQFQRKMVEADIKKQLRMIFFNLLKKVEFYSGIFW